MSRRRKQVIGGQVAAVAALVLVVYLTLLQPGDVGPLPGIEAPGGQPAPAVQQHGQGDRHRGEGKKNDRRPATGEDGAGSGGGVLVTEPPVAAAPAAPPATQVTSNPTPSGDQYGDAVDALLDKVGAGGVPHD